MSSNFWFNKKILLTGHTGFKGSWLTLWLTRLGAEVIGYSLDPPTNPSLFEVAAIGKYIESIRGDIRDLEHLKKTISDSKPDIVIHMAAQALVRLSYDDPIETYSSNVMGTVNVLEAIRTQNKCSVKSVLIITSDKCYENNEWVWGYRENERMGGKDPYSNSKGCAELVTSSYRDSFFPIELYKKHGVAIASARAGNVIGGGDWAKDRLIPDIIKAIEENRPVEIRNPYSIRPWQHVLEPLAGYMTLIEKTWNGGKNFSEAWNFGPDESSARNVSVIVEHITKLWGEKGGDNASWKVDQGDHVHEANYLKLDCSKAKSLLGFRPKLELLDSLTWVVDWFKAYHGGCDMHGFTLEQIEKYEKLNIKA